MLPDIRHSADDKIHDSGGTCVGSLCGENQTETTLLGVILAQGTKVSRATATVHNDLWPNKHHISMLLLLIWSIG